jgi:4-hydroxy-tetrahydrodipicolinate synthase
MGYETLRDQFRDVAFTTATPFDEAGAIDHEALRENLESMAEAGGRLFIPCGNTGEYYALSKAERKRVVETHVESLPAETTVVGGAGGPVSEAVDLAQVYERVGADAVMVMHPSHTFLHEAGLVEYYEQIVEATELGVVIYKRGPRVTRDVVASVVEHDSVVAVKFAVNDVAEFSATMARAPEDVAWVNGIAERFAVPFAAAGAVGYTTGIGNFAPEATLALFEALEAGEWARARRIQEAIRPFEELRTEAGAQNTIAAANNVPAIKHGLDAVGLNGGSVRPPLADLGPETRERTERLVEQIRSADLR